jgi:hypothetical protein
VSPPLGQITRIVVPLDAASESLVALETAARLAAHAGAQLLGIFVEDEELLHLAHLPFARQFTLGAAAEKLTTEHIELHLRIAAERTRRELFAAAEQHGVTASFEIVRGRLTAVSVSERDLVVAGALTRPVAGHFRVECRWWSSLEVMPGPFLLARHAWRPNGAVAVLLRDRSPAASRLLAAAAQIADAAAALLTILRPAGAERLDDWIADQLAGRPLTRQVEIAPADPIALRQRLSEIECRLLAIEAGRATEMREMVERYACDILIVR